MNLDSARRENKKIKIKNILFYFSIGVYIFFVFIIIPVLNFRETYLFSGRIDSNVANIEIYNSPDFTQANFLVTLFFPIAFFFPFAIFLIFRKNFSYVFFVLYCIFFVFVFLNLFNNKYYKVLVRLEFQNFSKYQIEAFEEDFSSGIDKLGFSGFYFDSSDSFFTARNNIAVKASGEKILIFEKFLIEIISVFALKNGIQKNLLIIKHPYPFNE